MPRKSSTPTLTHAGTDGTDGTVAVAASSALPASLSASPRHRVTARPMPVRTAAARLSADQRTANVLEILLTVRRRAEAAGHRFLDANGNPLPPLGCPDADTEASPNE